MLKCNELIGQCASVELHLLRHGETQWNRDRRVQGQCDVGLNETGNRQAVALGKRLADTHYDAIYCSSSLRTRETAWLAFPDRHEDLVFVDALREIDLGPWEGRLHAEIALEDPESQHHFWHMPHLFQVEGAETFFALQERAMQAIRDIARRHSGQRVAVVSHGALIKSVLCFLEELPMRDLWAWRPIHNCAQSIVQLERGGGEILQYADRPFALVKGSQVV